MSPDRRGTRRRADPGQTEAWFIGKEPARVRGSRPTTGPIVPLRDRLEGLSGLPIRPSTAHRCWSDTNGARPALDDPGWALVVSSRGESLAQEALDDLPWWSSCSEPAAEARDRLWRFSVSAATAAARLASSAGDPDPDRVARAALLQPLALWALAAVEPDRLSDWMNEADPRRRGHLETEFFGQDSASFGYHLARRWRCDAELLDATLLAGADTPLPEGLVLDSRRYELLRIARGWAMRTPWALPGPTPISGPTEDQRRWLVAAVQARCAGGLLANRSESPEDHLRAAVRQARRETQLRDELADLARRLASAVEAIAQNHSEKEGEQATRVLDAMAEFAAGAAHELNNPLAIIAGRAQLLQASLTDPEQRKSLQTILNQSRRAHQMLRDLIYIARPPTPRQVPCLPDQILRATVEDMSAEAESRQIRLRFRQNRSSPATASADPDALRHTADALIRNALEATPPGGEVLAESTADHQSLKWTVRDTGIGLDAERSIHLLDPFYCGREAGRGLGLGLPRVARFLRSIGGEIRWDEAPGGGTIVRVTLPLGPADDPPNPGPTSAKVEFGVTPLRASDQAM